MLLMADNNCCWAVKNKIWLIFLFNFKIKIFVYLMIVGFLFLRLFTNLNFKINFYDKIKNFKEIWFFNVNILDKFVFWNIYLLLNYFSQLGRFKFLLLLNWWVTVLIVVIFYNKSFKSVALKKLRI